MSQRADRAPMGGASRGAPGHAPAVRYNSGYLTSLGFRQEESMSPKNRQIILAARPSGEPTPDNFRLVEADVPRTGPGQMLLRIFYLSLDPYMRGRMNAGPSYAKPVEVGEVMEGRSVAEVIESKLPGY